MSASKKVLLFLVEGISDQTSLALLLTRIFTSNTVKVHIINGDITSNYSTSIQNVLIKVTENPSLTCFNYTPFGIIAPKREQALLRNKHKSTILTKISHTPQIKVSKIEIPYSTFFFSCNLEHVLHNIQNAPDSLKDELADSFLDKYIDHEDEFINFMCNSSFSVKESYLNSWGFIMEGLNSVQRYSNFNLILEQH